MGTPPWKIVGSVELGPQHSPSKTRHSVNGRELLNFRRLELRTYDGQEGCYLFHICADETGTDTWHQNLEDALLQAEWSLESSVKSGGWFLNKSYRRGEVFC
jgi:hypothetical protein